MTVKYIDPESFYIKTQIDFACAYGVNVAILTSKLYRLERGLTGKVDDQGCKWIRMSSQEWLAELPFWSEATIKRTIGDAQTLSILLTRNFAGRCKWYRLNPNFVSGQFDAIPKSNSAGKPVFGDESGKALGTNGIAKKLSGIETYADRRGKHLKKMGKGEWSKTIIHRILTSETYAGVWTYAKNIRRDYVGQNEPTDIKVEVPAIIVHREHVYLKTKQGAII